MEINFDQVRAAAHDDIAAKILREKWQLDDRSSASGAVVCNRGDIERMLASGRLEPVLTTEQFLSVSQGKAYGAGATSAPQSATHAEPLGVTDGTNWANHPDWAEFQSLSEPMKEACQRDFRTFLFVKRRVGIASLSEIVGGRIEADARERSRASARRTQEAALEALPVREAERFQAGLNWAKGKKNYPGLQNQKGG